METKGWIPMVFKHEPSVALLAPNQGLQWIGEWLHWAWVHLKKEGLFMFEFGKSQEALISPLIDQKPWSQRELWEDFSGGARFFMVRK